MDNPATMNAKQVALIAVMSALAIVTAYSRGLAISSLPGVFEFMTVLIFISGFCFGSLVGVSVGIISLSIYMLVPYPFAHPAAWLYTISPILLLVMAALGALFGLAGALSSKILKPAGWGRFSLSLAVIGFALTLTYDIVSSLGFALAYPAFSDPIQAIYLTFIPLYYPWPPIIHTFTNTIIFAVIAPPLIQGIRKLPETLNTGETKQKTVES
ncbi:hypothetical protein A3K78_07950 [Candidatus Bathyarchaeota archaeon RBG_13_52_12]|nr:MAG: hypothetical protein A3K78_07950 [Candidatus Bathyarchaeota archaeon RBG_13_52_12]